jgi:hypothetical protein
MQANTVAVHIEHVRHVTHAIRQSYFSHSHPTTRSLDTL